jgi:hypothetical protein
MSLLIYSRGIGWTAYVTISRTLWIIDATRFMLSLEKTRFVTEMRAEDFVSALPTWPLASSRIRWKRLWSVAAFLRVVAT